MASIKQQLQDEIKRKMQESIAMKNKTATPEKKSVGSFLSNFATDVTNTTKGLVGMGYEAITHPIKSAETVAKVGGTIAKVAPAGFAGTFGSAANIVTHPFKSTSEALDSYTKLKNVSLTEQKRIFSNYSDTVLKEQETGKKGAGLLGLGLMESFIGEVTHPGEYFYEKPFSFTLDALSAGKATGVNKVALAGVKKVPAVAKVESALRETFVPNGKLINAGYKDLSDDMVKTKGNIFKAQKNIIDGTAQKITKEFGLNSSERTNFFKVVDGLRREGKEAVAKSDNPKIQEAISWWVDEESPALAKLSGLPEEKRITNYMHHYFPDKAKSSDTSLGGPTQYSKKGYLKKSQDVAGFSEDPIVSIAAIKTKIATDALRDSFVSRTIKKYGYSDQELSTALVRDLGEDAIKGLDSTGIRDKAKKVFGLDEYQPKGKLRFFKSDSGVGVSTKVETHIMPKTVVEELNKFGLPKEENKLFMVFDVFNRNWKPLATSLRAKYHTRNILGNAYNSIVIGGTRPQDFGQALLGQVQHSIHTAIQDDNILGKVYGAFFKDGVPDSNILKKAIDNDIVGRGFFGADVNDLAKASENVDDVMKALKNINQPAEIYRVPILREYVGLSQKVGEFIEDNARLAMFQRGLKKFGDTEKGIQLSREYVDKHLFDYITGLSETDKQIRRVIPFWSWTRFNVPLQAEAVVAQPIKQAAINAFSTEYSAQKDKQDEDYQYLSDKQKEQGYMKVGEELVNGTKYNKYIKAASVLPQNDLAKIAGIFQGKFEDVGITPLINIAVLILKSPTELLDYFGQPIERFEGEKKKFLGMSITGKNKALLQTLPVLSEINTVIGGSYDEINKPSDKALQEAAWSPTGLNLVDPKQAKFFKELEEQKKISGSYQIGWETMYKRYIKKYQDTKEPVYQENLVTLESILKENGASNLDIAKLKIKAQKEYIKEAIQDKLNLN